MPEVVEKPELLRWAIDRSGLSTEDLLTKFPKLDAWKTGERRPTFRQLEQSFTRRVVFFPVIFTTSESRFPSRS